MSSEIKLLIVGGNGYVGTSIAIALKDKYDVTCTYHLHYTALKGVNHVPIPDLTDKKSCERFYGTIEPDIIIFCMGSDNESEAEKDPKKHQFIHSGSITHLLHSAELKKAKFIYLSSSYIFSGVEGNFSENDTPIPPSHLGKIKAGAENFIRSRSANYVIIRSAPLIGRGTIDHPSWIDKIREKSVKGQKILLSSKTIHNPIHINFLHKMIEVIINNDIKCKTFHAGGLTRISLFAFAKQFLTTIKLNPDLVEATDASSLGSEIDYSLNFTETLKSIEAEPLLLQQSFDLL